MIINIETKHLPKDDYDLKLIRDTLFLYVSDNERVMKISIERRQGTFFWIKEYSENEGIMTALLPYIKSYIHRPVGPFQSNGWLIELKDEVYEELTREL